MKIMQSIGGLLLAGLAATSSTAPAQTAPPAAASSTPAAPAPAAPDTSRWRYLTTAGANGILISDGTPGNEIRSVSTYIVLGQPQAGNVDGFLTRYEVNCETNMIKDLGSVAYAGAEARGTLASQTNGQSVQYGPSTLFEVVANFTCTGRTPSTQRRIVTGREAAIAYARTQMRH